MLIEINNQHSAFSNLMREIMYTRREFGMLTLAGLVPLPPSRFALWRASPDTTSMAAAADATVNGVRVGVQTYSF
ncbi:MAG: hypothetical protein DMF97_19960, partial [Acidobacteria bacterium]